MKKWLLIGFISFMMILAACGGGDNSGSDGGSEEGNANETAQGEELFQQNCASCHGGDLTGGTGPDLTNASDSYDQSEIVTIITEGKGSMPAQDVSEDEASQIADYVLSQ
ncbi:c-type cytochrome [Alkalibacillus almallahensis]|uniref:c-type cytochrome n=1 Tax=Alkalibacillus almallahensis TaxID=1379154 RepID=UPI0014206B6A|nr:cytochrome c [Alkalibacillus almallahensis]NIK12517.1 cytochrome c551 [Alkalibacillus almallahensis]